jgi:uncharacterized repeat protein (TIGR01451 family)
MQTRRLSVRRAPAQIGRALRPVYAAAAAAIAALILAAGATATTMWNGVDDGPTPPTTWNVGDVFAGIANGSYNVYSNSGAFKETISDGSGGFTTGCSFNPSLDKLYTTSFSVSKVVVYDNTIPHPIVQTITTGKASAESIVFAGNGHFFVGGPIDPEIEEYDASGTLIDNDTVAADGTGGPDWVDLAADQKTIFYTSESRLVRRFDAAADAQLPDFATLPGFGTAYALRLLPPGDGSGGLLVADRGDVKRLDGSGAVVQTYDVPGEDSWFSLNLDPNGTSFWAGDFTTNNFYRFNIATGAVEVGPIASGGSLFGICLKGEITAAIGNIVLTPPTAQNEAGTSHTVTATVTSSGNPLPGKLVSFSVIAGPNTGQVSDPNTGECSANSDCTTDANGQVSWTYTSNGSPGTDTIRACFDDAGTTKCATAEKIWVVSKADLSITKTGPGLVQSGGSITYDITVRNGGPANASNVMVNDPLPAGETLVSATPSQGTCSGTVTCNLGSISSGSSATIMIVADVRAPCGATLDNTATVSGEQPDPNPDNNSSSASALVFCVVAGGGNFVIGDNNATVGTSVTFWGAQWWKLNSLSGGTAPASFKGFAKSPPTVTCGTGWTTSPGNSAAPPPGPLPQFMGVIVASSISKSGSTVSGNTVHMVVVQTNPGYAPDPGHAGTGTVVAQIC